MLYDPIYIMCQTVKPAHGDGGRGWLHVEGVELVPGRQHEGGSGAGHVLAHE